MLRRDGAHTFAEGEAFRAAAIDLGGSSGRVVTAVVEGGRLRIDGLTRFANHTFVNEHGLHWDVQRLFRDARGALAAARTQAPIASVGVDSWSGDYALLGDQGRASGGLIDAPFHQRDLRTSAVIGPAHEVMSARELFASSGVNEMPFLTLFQLLADRDAGRLSGARRMLLIPDLFSSWLGGAEVAEATNASTTALTLPGAREWDAAKMYAYGLPESVFAEIVTPGTVTGVVSGVRGFPSGPSVRAADRAVVTAVASHDTASAIAAVPAVDSSFAYISCGTWALVGVETETPVLLESARLAGFTNELGVDGTVRFLHISPGMWIVNERLREWGISDGAGVAGLEQLFEAAEREPIPHRLLDIDAPDLLRPGNMYARICEQQSRAGAPQPESPAATIRLIVESLAESFVRRVEQASRFSGVDVRVIHIVGGGSQSPLLCQSVADRSGLTVVAGPSEATAVGNVLVQARALGAVRGGLPALRAVVRESFPLARYQPRR